MDRVTIYLRTALFSVAGAEAHLPVGAAIVEGSLVERVTGGLLVQTEQLRDQHGKALAEVSSRLMLPWAKIDHVLHHGE